VFAAQGFVPSVSEGRHGTCAYVFLASADRSASRSRRVLRSWTAAPRVAVSSTTARSPRVRPSPTARTVGRDDGRGPGPESWARAVEKDSRPGRRPGERRTWQPLHGGRYARALDHDHHEELRGGRCQPDGLRSAGEGVVGSRAPRNQSLRRANPSSRRTSGRQPRAVRVRLWSNQWAVASCSARKRVSGGTERRRVAAQTPSTAAPTR
jgi:hypothetical protein